jgi:Fur family peroxide stress response transcriptional regulator
MLGKSGGGRGGAAKAKLDVFASKCRAAGLKVTPQRMAVYKILLETDEHPPAETVYQRAREVFPNISLDTVNRALLSLNEIGAATVVEGSGDAKRFDGNLQRHQHFKCVKCKRIVDFYHKGFDNIKVPAGVRERFVVLRKTVYFEGVCDLCGQER